MPGNLAGFLVQGDDHAGDGCVALQLLGAGGADGGQGEVHQIAELVLADDGRRHRAGNDNRVEGDVLLLGLGTVDGVGPVFLAGHGVEAADGHITLGAAVDQVGSVQPQRVGAAVFLQVQSDGRTHAVAGIHCPGGGHGGGVHAAQHAVHIRVEDVVGIHRHGGFHRHIASLLVLGVAHHDGSLRGILKLVVDGVGLRIQHHGHAQLLGVKQTVGADGDQRIGVAVDQRGGIKGAGGILGVGALELAVNAVDQAQLLLIHQVVVVQTDLAAGAALHLAGILTGGHHGISQGMQTGRGAHGIAEINRLAGRLAVQQIQEVDLAVHTGHNDLAQVLLVLVGLIHIHVRADFRRPLGDDGLTRPADAVVIAAAASHAAGLHRPFQGQRLGIRHRTHRRVLAECIAAEGRHTKGAGEVVITGGHVHGLFPLVLVHLAVVLVDLRDVDQLGIGAVHRHGLQLGRGHRGGHGRRLLGGFGRGFRGGLLGGDGRLQHRHLRRQGHRRTHGGRCGHRHGGRGRCLGPLLRGSGGDCRCFRFLGQDHRRDGGWYRRGGIHADFSQGGLHGHGHIRSGRSHAAKGEPLGQGSILPAVAALDLCADDAVKAVLAGHLEHPHDGALAVGRGQGRDRGDHIACLIHHAHGGHVGGGHHVEDHLVRCSRLGDGGREAVRRGGRSVVLVFIPGEEALDGLGHRTLDGAQDARILLGDHDQADDDRRHHQQRDDHRNQPLAGAALFLFGNIRISGMLSLGRTDAAGGIQGSGALLRTADAGAQLLQGRVAFGIHRTADDRTLLTFCGAAGFTAAQRRRTGNALRGHLHGGLGRLGRTLHRNRGLFLHRRGFLLHRHFGGGRNLLRLLRLGIHFVDQTGKALRTATAAGGFPGHAGRIRLGRHRHDRTGHALNLLLMFVVEIHELMLLYSKAMLKISKHGPYFLHMGHTLL